jgi:hypothetical protein
MKPRVLSIQQQSIAKDLAQQFEIDVERIYFLNPDKPEEPWLPAESLLIIARNSGNFQTIDESFDQYVESLNQIIHRATVITKDSCTFTRSGVATRGEQQDIDDNALAAGRAVSAALTAAGFNPLKPGTVIELKFTPNADDTQSRRQDLRRIHAIAEQKGLIKRGVTGGVPDRSAYRAFLQEHFKTNTAAGFDATQRASLINRLDQLPDLFEDEFADVA